MTSQQIIDTDVINAKKCHCISRTEATSNFTNTSKRMHIYGCGKNGVILQNNAWICRGKDLWFWTIGPIISTKEIFISPSEYIISKNHNQSSRKV